MHKFVTHFLLSAAVSRHEFCEHNNEFYSFSGLLRNLLDILFDELKRSLESNEDSRKKRCGFCKATRCNGTGGRTQCPIMKKSIERGEVKYNPRKKRKKNTRTRQCQLCKKYGRDVNCISGSGNRDFCRYFDSAGKKKVPNQRKMTNETSNSASHNASPSLVLSTELQDAAI